MLPDWRAWLLRSALRAIEGLYLLTRKRVPPLYPYDRQSHRIRLPREMEERVRKQARAGDIAGAVRRVDELTGAGLRVSKEYVDQFRR